MSKEEYGLYWINEKIYEGAAFKLKNEKVVTLYLEDYLSFQIGEGNVFPAKFSQKPLKDLVQMFLNGTKPSIYYNKCSKDISNKRFGLCWISESFYKKANEKVGIYDNIPYDESLEKMINNNKILIADLQSLKEFFNANKDYLPSCILESPKIDLKSESLATSK